MALANTVVDCRCHSCCTQLDIAAGDSAAFVAVVHKHVQAGWSRLFVHEACSGGFPLRMARLCVRQESDGGEHARAVTK